MKMGAASTSKLSNGGGIVTVNADGSVSVIPASGTGLTLGVAPPATATRALFQIGNGPIDGSAGHYTGSASGGGFGANFASGYAGDHIRTQTAGVDYFRVDGSGNLTMLGAVTSSFQLNAPGLTFNGRGSIARDASTGGIQFAPQGGTATGSTFTPGTAAGVPLVAQGLASQTADLFQAQNSAAHTQFAVANVGTGPAPIWALRVRATANAESMAQTHTLGAYTGKSVQMIDDAGVTIGWQPLYA